MGIQVAFGRNLSVRHFGWKAGVANQITSRIIIINSERGAGTLWGCYVFSLFACGKKFLPKVRGACWSRCSLRREAEDFTCRKFPDTDPVGGKRGEGGVAMGTELGILQSLENHGSRLSSRMNSNRIYSACFYLCVSLSPPSTTRNQRSRWKILY